MDEPDLLNEIRILRDVVARTQPPAVNDFWPVTLSWGIVVSVGYLACALLSIERKFAVIPWVMPVLLLLVGWPLHRYFARKVELSIEERGIRPRYRKDLGWCWISISAIGMLWT